ncbi:MAG: hypothetical protein DRQ55_11555 [Planctomycetota bacterium]|nr:MAG: hypothetical protein DRQ55_11555 [Planctomycetota bacterium]
MRFFWKVLAGMTLAVVVTAWVADLRVSGLVQSSRAQTLERRARDDAWLFSRLARPLLSAGDEAGLGRLAADLLRQLDDRRITFIAGDGRVLADSHRDPSAMDNHAERPEVRVPGEVHRRLSDTLDRPMIYVALALRDGEELLGYSRVALDASVVELADGALRRELLLATLMALGAGLVLALIVSDRISRPLLRMTTVMSALGRGDYRQRVDPAGSSELRNMANVLNDVGRTLQERESRIVAEVSQKAAILSAMDEGLVAMDRRGRVVLLNNAARRMLAPGAADGVGARFADLARDPSLVDAAARCLSQAERCEGEIRVGPGGEEGNDLAFVVTPVLDPSGRAEMAVLVVHDVTTLRRLEQVRSDFVANVSHELKTPLTTMRGYIEALLDDPDLDSDQRGRFLMKAGRSTERLTAIVSDLLDLARLERGPDHAGAEPVDLAELVADCVSSVQNDADERGVRLQVSVEDAPLVLRGDDPALVIAVTNLLNNAVKYSPVGGVVDVRLGLEPTGEAAAVSAAAPADVPADAPADVPADVPAAAPGAGLGDEPTLARRCVRLSVADQGPGIPLEAQERIFERFFRVDKDRSRQLGGTGLGLSIVRNVISTHGGEVWVESTPGQGSCFHVRLRLSEPL